MKVLKSEDSVNHDTPIQMTHPYKWAITELLCEKKAIFNTVQPS